MVGTEVTGKRLGIIDMGRVGSVNAKKARSSIIDDDALIADLSSGKVTAAGLDVFNNEPALHPGYLQLPNTFLLPPIGSATADTREAMGFGSSTIWTLIFQGRRCGTGWRDSFGRVASAMTEPSRRISIAVALVRNRNVGNV